MTAPSLIMLSHAELDEQIEKYKAILANHEGARCCWHSREAAAELQTYLWLRGDKL